MSDAQVLSADIFLKAVEHEPEAVSFLRVHADSSHAVHAVFDIGGQLVSLCEEQFRLVQRGQTEALRAVLDKASERVDGAIETLEEISRSRKSRASPLHLAFDSGRPSATQFPEIDPRLYLTPMGPTIFGLQCVYAMCKKAAMANTVGNCRGTKSMLRVV